MSGIRPGPPPKPDDVRQRTNEPTVEQTRIEADELPDFIDSAPVPPQPGERWHAVVKEAWADLLKDPVRLTMTTGDWAVTKIVFESMSRAMMPQVVGVIQNNEHGPGDVVRDVVPVNGSQMAAFLKHMNMLGITEGARRSMGLHIRLGLTSDALAEKKGPAVVKTRDQLMLLQGGAS